MINKDILGFNPSKLMYVNLELFEYGKPYKGRNGIFEYKEEFVDYDNYYPLWFSKLFNIKKTYEAGYRDSLNNLMQLNCDLASFSYGYVRTTPEKSCFMDIDGKLHNRHELYITFYFGHENKTLTTKHVVKKFFNTLEDVSEYEIDLITEYKDKGVDVLSCWNK